MVDRIKNFSAPSSAPRPSANSLRTSFQSLSSGRVTEQAKTSRKAVAADVPAEPKHAASILSDLNEAVSLSSRAVRSLEQISQSGQNGAPSDADDGFTKEISRLRDDIDRVRSRMDVLSENINSAGAALQDVDAAQAQARKTGSEINQGGPTALDAHSNLDPDKVARLLLD